MQAESGPGFDKLLPAEGHTADCLFSYSLGATNGLKKYLND